MSDGGVSQSQRGAVCPVTVQRAGRGLVLPSQSCQLEQSVAVNGGVQRCRQASVGSALWGPLTSQDQPVIGACNAANCSIRSYVPTAGVAESEDEYAWTWLAQSAVRTASTCCS